MLICDNKILYIFLIFKQLILRALQPEPGQFVLVVMEVEDLSPFDLFKVAQRFFFIPLKLDGANQFDVGFQPLFHPLK